MSLSAQTHAVNYGKENINFSLTFSQRRTLSISVNPDLSVTVTAPKDAPIEEIKQKIPDPAGFCGWG